MATNPMDIQKRINEMHNQQKNTGLAELRASQQKAVGGINQQKTQIGQQYYDKRNQADVVNFQNRSALREMMASQGLNNSGENISANVGLSAARQNTLGGLNQDEQNIMGGLDSKIAEINDPSRQNSLIAQIESQRSQALAQAMERAMERAEQQRQFDTQLAWQKEQFNRRGRGGGGSGDGPHSHGVPEQTQSSMATLYDQYKQQQQQGANPALSAYYQNEQKKLQPTNGPYRTNPYVQPVAPADKLSPYEQIRLLRGR